MIKKYILDWFEKNCSYKASDMDLVGEKNYLETGIIDSFGFLKLIASCEEEFNIFFSDDDFSGENIFSINGLIGIIEKK